MPRGSKPGERRGGRHKGIANKATGEVKALARKWGPEAITMAAEMAGLVPGKKAAQSEAARLAAIGMILDRGYGKPTQTIAGDENNPLRVMMATVDRPPDETREQWLARRARELGVSAQGVPLARRPAS